MKKRILLGGIALLLIFIVSLCVKLLPQKETTEKHLRTIKLAEVTHSMFYAPLYVAMEAGYFADEGIAIDLILTSGAHNVTAAVLSGDVEVGFCGSEAGIYVYNEGVKDYIQTFAGITKRDGQFIVAKQKYDNFTMQDLKGKTVLGGRRGGMPILNFMTAVRNAGVDIKSVNIDDSVDLTQLSSAFLSGNADFVVLFEPNATKLEKEGLGYIVETVGKYSGEVPYTSLNAKKSFIKNNPEIISGMRNAVNKGLKYVKDHDGKAIAKIITSQFPDLSINDLIAIINRYKEADSWLDNTNITEKSFETLEDTIIAGGFIKEYVPFADIIINE